jgi:acetylornithine/N-succinyldiaminopimelate aminotransferase
MAIASKVVDIIADKAFLNSVQRQGSRLRMGLEVLVGAYPDAFSEVRGEGLLLGLRCVPPVEIVVATARANGLLSVVAGDNVLRLLPPLNLSDVEAEEGLARLQRVAEALAFHKLEVKESA